MTLAVISLLCLVAVPAWAVPLKSDRPYPDPAFTRYSHSQLAASQTISEPLQTLEFAHCCHAHTSYPFDRNCCHTPSKDSVDKDPLVPSYPSTSYVPSYPSQSFVPSYDRSTSGVRGGSRGSTGGFTGRR